MEEDDFLDITAPLTPPLEREDLPPTPTLVSPQPTPPPTPSPSPRNAPQRRYYEAPKSPPPSSLALDGESSTTGGGVWEHESTIEIPITAADFESAKRLNHQTDLVLAWSNGIRCARLTHQRKTTVDTRHILMFRATDLSGPETSAPFSMTHWVPVQRTRSFEQTLTSDQLKGEHLDLISRTTNRIVLPPRNKSSNHVYDLQTAVCDLLNNRINARVQQLACLEIK